MKFGLLILLFFVVLAASAQKLVLPGAYPDPSVTQIGNSYWASATTSNWFPAFPLMQSKDLVKWEHKGYIFSKMPDWADYYFWAPEITYDSGRVYVYYTAHKKDGNLCVAVASADKPEGPYKDHGPLVCQQYGSIDAFPIRDTSGKLYLVWKEDANSVNLPTPIWAQEMNEERTALIGERFELFRNDAPWEKELVEGVAMIRKDSFYYAMYAAAGCCGDRCTYVTGVARARSVLGPWEKYHRNPILVDDSTWLCKGHGTALQVRGRYFFLYHGYDRRTSAFTGREGLLQEFRFTDDAWIEFVPAKKDSIIRQEIIRDEFDDDKLGQNWQWNVFKKLNYKLDDGRLKLFALPGKTGSFIAQKISSADYIVTTTVDPVQSNAYAGLAAIGDENNVLGLVIKDFELSILKVQNGIDSVTPLFRIPVKEKIYLQMNVEGPYRITFFYSMDGEKFIPINSIPFRGAYLPPWDSPPRAGLIAIGETNEVAVFERFELRAGALKSSEVSEVVFKHKVRQLMAILVYILVAIPLLLHIRKYWKGR